MNRNTLLIILGTVCISLAMILAGSTTALYFHESKLVKSKQETISQLKKKNKELQDQAASLEEEKAEAEEKQAKAEEERDAALAQLEQQKNVPQEDAEIEEQGEISEQNSESLFSPGKALDVSAYSPGEIVDVNPDIDDLSMAFQSYEIREGDAVFNRIYGRSYYENPNITLADLRYLKVLHYNFAGQVQVGEIIVNAALAEDVMNIFKDLMKEHYSVNSMFLVDNYWTGDGTSSDSLSIDHNNTSSFCYREQTGGGQLSNHALGRAIDINPQQNPYVWYDENGGTHWTHDNATPYIDRGCGDPHVIVKGDICYNIFAKYGFSWAGEWTDGRTDYQHFYKEY